MSITIFYSHQHKNELLLLLKLLNMGNLLRKKKKKKFVIMIGLNSSGKSTITYALRSTQPVTTVPTIGGHTFYEEFRYNDAQFVWWDVGESINERFYDYYNDMLRSWFYGVDGIVFVVDSNDSDTINDAHCEFQRILWTMKTIKSLYQNNKKCVIMLLANKQDLSNSMNGEEVQHKMGLFQYKTWTKNELNDIKQNTMLKYLPNELFNIIKQYAKHKENGISLKLTAKQLMNAQIPLIDKYFGTVTQHGWNCFNYSDENIQIMKVICDYLPILHCTDISHSQCAIFECCALTPNVGLYEAFDWFLSTMNKINS
eukprot:409994_1